MDRIDTQNRYLQRRTVRYVISGILSFIIENVVFSSSADIVGLTVVYSNTISILIALLVNFFVSKNFVFQNKTKHKPFRQFSLYAGLVLFNLIVSTILINYLISYDVIGYVAKFLVTSLAVVWTYIIYKKIVFKE